MGAGGVVVAPGESGAGSRESDGGVLAVNRQPAHQSASALGATRAATRAGSASQPGVHEAARRNGWVAIERTLGWVTEALPRHKPGGAGESGRRARAGFRHWAVRPGAIAAALFALQWVSPALADVAQNSWYQAGRAAIERMHAERPPTSRAKNVIVFVGDGMGVTTVTAARILEGQLAGKTGEENLLSFERFPHVALAKTYNTNQQVPDSAGTMTAMMSGVKTKAGVIGVDDSVARGDHTKAAAASVPTLFELAEARGLSTGIVTTTRITHATPAACYAHSPERNWENDARLPEAARTHGFRDLARQMIDFPNSLATHAAEGDSGAKTSHQGDGLEVALGGGRANFLSSSAGPALSAPDAPTMGQGSRLDGRNLIAQWQRGQGASYVSNSGQLEAVDPATTRRLLGLFSPSHMDFDADRDTGPEGEPSLAQMTAKAIEILSREESGFVLMVEGGRIDQAHHTNNAYRALTDTIAFSDAVRTATLMTKPEETLIVVTADHSHTLTLSGYPHRGNDILGLVRGNDLTGETAKELTLDQLGKPYTSLGYANGPGYTGASEAQPEGPKKFRHIARKVEGIENGRPDLSEVPTNDRDYLQEATFPLGYETHSGEDVAIYARGPSAWLFNGIVEQNYIFHAITEALGWNREPDGARASQAAGD